MTYHQVSINAHGPWAFRSTIWDCNSWFRMQQLPLQSSITWTVTNMRESELCYEIDIFMVIHVVW